MTEDAKGKVLEVVCICKDYKVKVSFNEYQENKEKYEICPKCGYSHFFNEILLEYQKAIWIEKNKSAAVVKLKKTKLNPKEVLTCLALKERNDATELLVQEFLLNNHVYTTRDDLKSEMWIYHDGIYIPQGKTFVSEFVRDILDKAFSSNLLNCVIAKIEVDTYINQNDFFINEDINKVPVLNGILNLEKKYLEPFSPEYKFFNKLPITFDKKKKCNSFIKFLGDVLPKDKDLLVMQELFGYLLYRDYKIEKAFMFSGDGRNGKGKTIEVMKKFIGIDNTSNVSLNRIEKDKFSIGELFNKMANLCGDLSKTALENTGNFKQLTGHDMVSAQRKFLNDINFTNYAKFIFAANEMPKTNDTTIAFFNRWVMITFPYTFLGKRELASVLADKEVPEDQKKFYKLADKEIIKKISTEPELSGILNWALIGLKRLLKQSDFSDVQTSKEVSNSWRRKSSSFSAFCMDKIEYEYDSFVKKSDLKNEYSKYCKVFKLKPESDKIINSILTTDYSSSTTHKRTEDGKLYFWRDINLIQVD